MSYANLLKPNRKKNGKDPTGKSALIKPTTLINNPRSQNCLPIMEHITPIVSLYCNNTYPYIISTLYFYVPYT